METDWAFSFIVPGVVMGIAGFVIFLFLAANPSEIGLIPPAPTGYKRLDATHSSDESSCSEDVESGQREDQVNFFFFN